MIAVIDIPLYRAQLVVVFDLQVYTHDLLKEKIASWFHETRVKEAEDYFIPYIQKHLDNEVFCAAETMNHNMMYIIVFNEPMTKKAASIGEMTHEVFHVAAEILRKVGLKESSKSTEAYAYLIGYLAEQVMLEYDKFCDWWQATFNIDTDNGQTITTENSSPSSSSETGS